MSSTGTVMNQYSTEATADSYWGYTDGLQTIQVVYAAYIGRIRIQASLSLTPTADDWFDLVPTTVAGTAFNSDGYVEFLSAKSGSEAYTVQGNFTYLRVYMDRESGPVGDGVTYIAYGQIMAVVLAT